MLEHAIVWDYGLVRAAKGDRHGNLVYDASTRNSNPLCAVAERITIAEVEQLVEPGELGPSRAYPCARGVHASGRRVGEDGKLIERRTTRPRREA